MATNAGQSYIDALKNLIEEYDAYVQEIAPYNYRDGATMKAIHEQKDRLFALQPGEALTHGKKHVDIDLSIDDADDENTH